MRRVSLNDLELKYDQQAPEALRKGSFGLGDVVGAKGTGMTLYELAPGQAVSEYHIEYVEEEWILVLEGRVTVRTPEGTEELGEREVGFFAMGAEGAHQVRNDSAERALIVMFANRVNPGAVEYPDSGRMTVWIDENDWFGVKRTAPEA